MIRITSVLSFWPVAATGSIGAGGSMITGAFAGGFTLPVPFFQAGLIHAWLSRRA